MEPVCPAIEQLLAISYSRVHNHPDVSGIQYSDFVACVAGGLVSKFDKTNSISGVTFSSPPPPPPLQFFSSPQSFLLNSFNMVPAVGLAIFRWPVLLPSYKLNIELYSLLCCYILVYALGLSIDLSKFLFILFIIITY